MRMLLKAHLPSEAGDMTPAARFETLRAALGAMKPESVYFYPENGERTMIIVFDLPSTSELPPLVEPFFRQHAKVSLTPVMTLEDLQAGMQKIKPA